MSSVEAEVAETLTPSAVAVVAAQDAAAVGLLYVEDFSSGFTRVRAGDGFAYLDTDGKRLRDREIINRINRLAIPPAWEEVWIAPRADHHIQAIGRDARGRRQYRYHAEFRSARDGNKFGHLTTFARALPRLRRTIDRDLRRRGLPREKVLAAVISLLDRTHIRVGNDEYAASNHSYGLSTLRDRHVQVAGDTIEFRFKGKSGKRWHVSLHDHRLARIVKSCQDLPGQHLFQYVDHAGEQHAIGSADVNAYLHEATGAQITAKDFRTWNATQLAALLLHRYPPFDSQALAKANMREAIEAVAAELGNTPTICRKSYIHPAVLAGYLDGSLSKAMSRSRRGTHYFDGVEAGVAAYLERATRGSSSAPQKSVARQEPTGRSRVG